MITRRRFLGAVAGGIAGAATVGFLAVAKAPEARAVPAPDHARHIAYHNFIAPDVNLDDLYAYAYGINSGPLRLDVIYGPDYFGPSPAWKACAQPYQLQLFAQ